MKKLFYFLAISLLLIGCEDDNPESKRPLNQPCYYSKSKGLWVIDKDWTPIGHVYYSEEHDAIAEFTESNIRYYSHLSDFLSGPDSPHSEECLRGEYPNFTNTAGIELNFKDTLSFTSLIVEYKLYR